MAVAFINPGVKKVRSAKGKTIQLVRALNDRGAKAPAPETPAKETVRMEFPYDDLYLMYCYITKELGIRDPFNE
jgi:hypothetical protein